MDIQPLRYFFEVAKVKNFTRAAKNCHVAQPALSQQIRRLETLLGVKLLQRLPRGAMLTPEGEILLPYVQNVLNAVQETENAAQELRGVTRGTVKIVSLPSACVYVLPPRVAAFKREHPRIDIVMEESVSAGIPELVHTGGFDLGVTQAPGTVAHMNKVLIHDEDLLLAVPSNHKLAGRDEIDLLDAAGENFIVTKPDTEFRYLAADLCRSAGFEMNVAFEADHFDSLQAYSAVGMGVALIPRSVLINTLTPAPRYLRIRKPLARRRLWLLYPKRGLHNKAAEAMIPFLVGSRR